MSAIIFGDVLRKICFGSFGDFFWFANVLIGFYYSSEAINTLELFISNKENFTIAYSIVGSILSIAFITISMSSFSQRMVNPAISH